MDSTKKSHSGINPYRLQIVLEMIESRFPESIGVHELAAKVQMSPFHFARMFKVSTDIAPHAYLIRRRVEHAKNLLETSTKPLKHVAASAGFKTQAHFTWVFHRKVGMTPRAYRLASQRSAQLAAAMPANRVMQPVFVAADASRLVREVGVEA